MLFWQRVREHVSLTMPICKLLRRHDSSAPSVGKVYHGWFEVGESIAESSVPYAQTAKEKYDDRWVHSHSPFFAAAYVLDPEFVEHDQASLQEVMEGFFETLSKVAVLMKLRKLQREEGAFTDIWQRRVDAIKADPTHQLKNYPL